MAEVAEGTVVDGRYRIKNRIGSGGMADVYCAQDSQLGRNVALKMLHRRFARDQQFVERFRREASAAAGLQHPNVVGVFDRGEYDGTYYIAMEHLPGRTLKELIRNEAPLPQERAIDIAIQILQAASFAHRHGVVHRDFKPHNVIVGPDDRLKVTDFGIARAGASEMTETGSIMGTAQYLSPEQAQGQRVGAPSDIYSIGVIVYEMLSGHVPFTGESAVSIALKHVSEQPPALRSVRPKINAVLEQAVYRALAKDPEHRWASAEDFIAALEQARTSIRSGGNGSAGGTASWAPMPPPPYEYDYDQRGRRWPWVVLALLALALALAAVLWHPWTTNRVTVPGVTKMKATRATAVLKAAGFKVKAHGVESNAKTGLVVSQDPAGGSEAPKNSTVDLAVSSGPGTALVPSVTNLTAQQAQQTLNDAGFQVTQDQQPDPTIPQGIAIKTAPPESSLIPRGSRVRLFISSGPPKVVVPGVVGQDESTATGALQDAGLKVTRKLQDSNSPKGQVIAQNPTAGTSVNSGTRVTITVSKGQPKVQVPDVSGEQKAQARSDLEALGLKVKAVNEQSATQTPGTVTRQTPPPDSKVAKGSTVTIYVAQAPTGTGGTGPGGQTTPGATGSPAPPGVANQPPAPGQ